MDTFEQDSLSKEKLSAGNGAAKEEIPRYQRIACDVASKIAAGVYPEGTKLYARSALASQYGVSSETARRAICVLADLGIVESSIGSGITVISEEKAVAFVRQFRQLDTIADLQKALHEKIRHYRDDFEAIVNLLEEIRESTTHYRTINPFVPYQFRLSEDCPHLGKTLQDLNFWHLTLATVVAIGRDKEIILSPGPYEILKDGDVVYYIGNPECVDRVHRLLTDSE